MAEAAVATSFPIGTEGLQGAVTTPREAAAWEDYRKALAARRAEAPKPTLEGMIEAIDGEALNRAAAVRVALMEGLGASTYALDLVIALDAAMEFLQLVTPHRAAVWNIIKPRPAKRGNHP